MMTESNYELVGVRPVPSSSAFENNVCPGFTTLVTLGAPYEGSLNTLLREVCGCGGMQRFWKRKLM